MKKTTAEILNAIPDGMDLFTYFDSLNIFDKRELINELEVCKGFFTKNSKRNKYMFLICQLISFSCYFGVREVWFLYYLLALNFIPCIILHSIHRKAAFYDKIIRILEERLSE